MDHVDEKFAVTGHLHAFVEMVFFQLEKLDFGVGEDPFFFLFLEIK